MADSVKTENMAPPPELRDAGPPPSEDLPPPDVLQKVAGLEVLDAEGKAHPFASLYSGPDVTARVLVIFVRNVFCGSCHAYIQAVSAELTPEKLKAAGASIVVVGCDDTKLIESYKEYASSQDYPMYVDPSETLYKALGTCESNARGSSSTYVTDSFLGAVWNSALLVKQHITSGLFLKAGNSSRNGGEFLFETVGEGKREMTWCHLMKNTTDHTSVEDLKKLLRV